MNFSSILIKLKHHIENCLNDFYTDGYKNIRLYQYCVSSEDIKYEAGADSIFCERQIDFGGMLIKNDAFYGYIDGYEGCLGSDIVIEKIVIYHNEKLSEQLTNKWRGYVLICSRNNDHFGS